MKSTLEARVKWVGLGALVTFSAMAITGYATFALRPQNLAKVPYGPEFFGLAFPLFAQLHILLGFSVLTVVLLQHARLRWIPAMLAVCALSFTAEHVGTGYGFPFGGYAYTALLGPRIGPRVPALIPVSWFMMALPCWVIARAAFPASRTRRLTLAALGLVLWDLALDPAMSALTPYWIWEETGPYYGMPWLNLIGWFVTGLTLAGTLELLAERSGLDRLPVRWMAAYYATVVLLPLGMLAAAGSWLGVVTTLGAIGVSALAVSVARADRTRQEIRSGAQAATSPVAAS